MSENKLNFLRSQIAMFHPEWTKEQVHMEAIKIYNESNTIDDDEDCFYYSKYKQQKYEYKSKHTS
jgi:hypothetical protein